MDWASAVETVDSGSIPGRVKPKTIKIWYSQLPCLTFSYKRTLWTLHCVWWTDGQVAAWLEDWKVPSLSPGQGNLINQDVITILYCVVLGFDFESRQSKHFEIVIRSIPTGCSLYSVVKKCEVCSFHVAFKTSHPVCGIKLRQSPILLYVLGSADPRDGKRAMITQTRCKCWAWTKAMTRLIKTPLSFRSGGMERCGSFRVFSSYQNIDLSGCAL